MRFIAFNHNDRVIACSDSAEDILAQAIEYQAQTGNAYYLKREEDLIPLCPRCSSVLSRAEYHLSSSDYFGACLECYEDFYLIEIREFEENENA
jgi:hypothetical protein